MTTQTPFPGFSCDDCGGVSVRIDGPLNDLAPVRCTGCGKDLGSWDIFLDELMRALEMRGVPHAQHSRHAQPAAVPR
ncbi:MAG TPA: hypothetical protein VGU45_02795 [Microvirga sp.]|jgi:hypothetical protein|nr:hypothetical protein [Microvirga sp.]